MKPQINLVKKRLRTSNNLSFCYIPNYPVLNGFLRKPRFHNRNAVFKVIFLGSMQPERCYDQLIEAVKINIAKKILIKDCLGMQNLLSRLFFFMFSYTQLHSYK